jgi:uridine phosphorylase/SAM-dependent methyltransferase
VADDGPPIQRPKRYDEASVFQVESLLREGRRQRELPDVPVPEVCVLDPDGDVVRHLSVAGQASRHPGWACYHSELWVTERKDRLVGIVPCVVGAPYAVLVAEELHASGCRLIVSVTSAGRIQPLGTPPYFVLIERAWRDEGTSVHYLAPSEWAYLRPELGSILIGAFDGVAEPVRSGASWTTDAPFRETPSAIAAAERAGIHAVEMEAAGLYAYATARQRDVVCVAHVTNTMAVAGDDFEKGADSGTQRILALVDAIAAPWAAAQPKTTRRQADHTQTPDSPISEAVPMSEGGEHWDRVYDAKNPTEVSWYQREPTTSLEFIEELAPERGAAIIDIGSGESSVVDRLLDDGFTDVTVLDISQHALDEVTGRLAGRAHQVAFIHHDVLTWRPERHYDVWHDRAVFHFLVEAEARDRYVGITGRAVKAGGFLVLAAFAEDGPTSCSGLPVSRYSSEQLQAAFAGQFTLVKQRREEHVTPNGAVQPFSWVVLRRDRDPGS